MIDERELQSAIQECLDNPSSANVCQRLASYMVIQDHLFNDEGYSNNSNSTVVLPAYEDFANAKLSYQMGRGNESSMIETLNALLHQIKSLLHTLYANATTERERASILETLQELNTGKL